MDEILKAIMKDLVRRYSPAEINTTVEEKEEYFPTLMVHAKISSYLSVDYIGRLVEGNIYISLTEHLMQEFGTLRGGLWKSATLYK